MALAVDSEMATNTGFGAGPTASPGPSSPQTFSFTNTAGTVLYVAVGLAVITGGTTSFGTVSYNGVSMTNVVNQATASGASRVGVFRLLTPATGSNTVSLGFTLGAGGSNAEVWAGCISFTGNNTTTPEAQSAGSNGSGTSGTASLVGVASGNISVGWCGAGTAMSGQTQTLSWAKNVADDTLLGNGRSSRSTSSGSVTHSFTIGASDSWASAIVEVAAASAAASAIYPHTFTAIPVQAQGRNL